MKPSTLRKITVAAVFVLVAISLATNAATGTLSAIGFESIALICPVGALEVMLGLHQFLLHPFILLVVAVAVVLLVGKAFCAWLCPTPVLQALFHPSKKKKGKKAAKIKGASDGAALDDSEAEGVAVADALGAAAELTAAEKASLSGCGHSCGSCASLAPCGGKRDGFKLDTRFAVLGGALASAAIFGFPVFCLICPVGLTFATFIGLWHLFQFNETTWGLLLFPALLVLELVVLRKWCHKFCPISAVLSLVSTGNRFLKPRVDEAKCLRSCGIDCHACVDACPELLDPRMSDIPECSKCGKCKEVCPAGAISFPFFARKKAGASAIERDKAPDATPASGVEDFDGSSAEA